MIQLDSVPCEAMQGCVFGVLIYSSLAGAHVEMTETTRASVKIQLSSAAGTDKARV